MRILLPILLGILVADNPPEKQTDVDVLFSPNGGCTDRIVSEIGQARKTLRVQAYSFTSARIAKAILDAQKRGVDCQVILDQSQVKQTYSEVTFFYNQQIPLLIDSKHAIAHNKIILIDDSTIITGSFNFSKAAEESNAENLLIIKGRADLAAKYAANYAAHAEHSQKYEGKPTGVAEPRGPPSDEERFSEAKSSSSADDPIVYVTKSGGKYHRQSCSYLRSSAIPLKLSEAAGRYGPCSRCGPPTRGSSLSAERAIKPAENDRPSSVGSGGQCTATTKKGTRCKRSARSGGRCWQHGG